MSGAKPAVLSSALLFSKGRAFPTGFLANWPEIVRNVAAEPAAPQPRVPRPANGGGSARGGAARVSFRLDAIRHYRLKLAMAHLRQSGQALILAALDHYLNAVVPSLLAEGCDCLRRAGGTEAAAGGQASCGATGAATPRP